MKIVYLINQYPHASHTFIRSEIEGLESLEMQIERITVVESRGQLVDHRDERERRLLRLTLKRSYPVLLFYMLATLLKRPLDFFRAFACAWRTGRRSHTGLLHHFGYLAEACVLLRWTARNHVDHVHAHFGTNSTAIALLCWHMGGPSYSFTIHGTETFDTPAFLSLAEKAEHADFVATVSWHGRALLMRWTPVHLWSKYRLVRCFPDPLLFTSAGQPLTHEPRLACVARLSEEKGVFTLLDAAERLMREGLEFEITIIGDGPLREDAALRVRESNLDACVRFVGWGSNQDVKNAILASRALVHPSYAEGLPVAIMESLALARPVVATYVGGIPELVRPGVDGWLVPAGDAEALADAMRAAITADPLDLTRMGRSGRERLRELHGPKKEIAKLNEQLRAANRKRAA